LNSDEDDPKAIRDELFRELAALRVDRLNIGFNGSGDNGQVESIEAVTEGEGTVEIDQPCALSQRTAEVGSGTWDRAARAYAYPDGHRPMTVRELIEEWLYAALDEAHPGWEIDAGSSGTITLHVLQGTATCELEARHSEYCEYQV
jgi:hypothetical protein